MHILKIDDARIKVVYPGASKHSYIGPQESDPAALKKLGIRNRYILSLSTIEPRKNFINLVEAWAQAKKSFKDESLCLVIAGSKGWGWPGLEAKIKSLKLDNDVIVTGYINNDERDALYRNCEFFVFPSFYEGFGLPVLEAMNFRKAVISSRASSMPEITADSALLVDPASVESIAEAIVKLATDTELRISLAENAIERSKAFSWGNTAREVIGILEKQLNDKRR